VLPSGVKSRGKRPPPRECLGTGRARGPSDTPSDYPSDALPGRGVVVPLGETTGGMRAASGAPHHDAKLLRRLLVHRGHRV